MEDPLEDWIELTTHVMDTMHSAMRAMRAESVVTLTWPLQDTNGAVIGRVVYVRDPEPKAESDIQ